ncbi:unnamed protein product [Soboliphyme baturini]|uniref:BTB domain-containing protein n=1 Tax=Soboliphyme baturini TaxID=241478 RepID=A0A183IB71_9BILA|nr:unnamed protein product [Soboliphyme baturini]
MWKCVISRRRLRESFLTRDRDLTDLACRRRILVHCLFNRYARLNILLEYWKKFFSRFYSHKIVLVKCSEVFERMLSKEWNGNKKEIQLKEDAGCSRVFSAFLRFLYCNHIVLHQENALPVLTLADKYNVTSLRKVALDYAVTHIIPQLQLKEIFHSWFQYGTKCFHQLLASHCVEILASSFQDIISCPEWEKEWLSLDREQLAEFLKSSDLVVVSEYELWLAVFRWLQHSAHLDRRGANTMEKNLIYILPLIRFPMMTADELCQVEKCPIVEQYPKLFQPFLYTAYKFRSLPLSSRMNCREFTGSQFLLRNYSGLRWDKRLVIQDFSSIARYTEISLKVRPFLRDEDVRYAARFAQINTCGSTIPPQPWDWELKLHPKGFSGNCDEFRCFLVSNVILDQTRAVEYLLSIVDDKKVLRSVTGKKVFSKSRYGSDLEMEKKVSLDEIFMENSPLLINDSMILQFTLRPIE